MRRNIGHDPRVSRSLSGFALPTANCFSILMQNSAANFAKANFGCVNNGLICEILALKANELFALKYIKSTCGGKSLAARAKVKTTFGLCSLR